MADDVGLKYILAADVKEFNAALDQAEKKVQETAAAATKASGAFVLFDKGLNSSAKAAKAFVSDARAGQVAYEGFGQSAVNAGQAVKAMSSTMKVNANGAFIGFNRIVQDSAYGMIGVANNIQQTAEQFGILIKQTGSAGAAFKAFFASFSGVNLVLLGISAITTAWTIYSQRQQKAASATKKTADEINNLGRALIEAQKNFAKETASLDAIVRAINNANVPMKTRVGLIEELQKKYPDYFGKLSKEEALTGGVTEAYKRLRTALLDVAKARAIQDALAKNAAARLDLEQKRVDLAEKTLKISKQQQAAEASIARGGTGTGGAGGAGAVGFAQIAQQQAKALQAVRKEAKDTEAELAKLDKRDASLISAQDRLIQTGGKAGAGIEDFGKKAKKAREKAFDTLPEILAGLNQELTILDNKAQASGATFKDLGENKIKAFEQAIERLTKIGIGPGSQAFDQIKKQIEEIQRLLKPGALPTPSFGGAGRDQLDMAGVFNTQPILSGGRAFMAAVDKVTADVDRRSKEFSISVEKQKDLIGQGINDFASGLGAALADGGGFSSVVTAFGSTLAGLLRTLGQMLIEAGVEMLAIKNAIKALIPNPALAIAAGIAATVVASALQASLSKRANETKINSFATGGIVSTPQLALVGDNPGRKEAIIPSELWGKMGGNAGEIVGETVISGSNLRVILKRADREQGRVS